VTGRLFPTGPRSWTWVPASLLPTGHEILPEAEVLAEALAEYERCLARRVWALR